MNNKFIYSIIHLFFEHLCIVTCDLKDVTMWEKYCSQSINFCEPAGCPGICIYSIRKKKRKKKKPFPLLSSYRANFCLSNF